MDFASRRQKKREIQASIWESLLGEKIKSVKRKLGIDGNMVLIGHGLERLEGMVNVEGDVGVNKLGTVTSEPVYLLLLSLSKNQRVVPKSTSIILGGTVIHINLMADINTEEGTEGTEGTVSVDDLKNYLLFDRTDSWPEYFISTFIAYLRNDEWKYDSIDVSEYSSTWNNTKRWYYSANLPKRDRSPRACYDLWQVEDQ